MLLPTFLIYGLFDLELPLYYTDAKCKVLQAFDDRLVVKNIT